TAGIDLSIGGIVFFAAVCGGEGMLKLSGANEQVIAGEYPHATLGVAVGVLLCLLPRGVCGLAHRVLITQLEPPPFIVTLGMLGITFGLGEVIDGGSYLPAPVPPGLSDGFGAGKFLGIFYPVWLAAIILVLAHIAFVYARFGRYTRAAGSNAEA